ncbi:MAG: hypothetical protein Q8K64_11985 [Sediminibacterium sp.]|nr:hypothetical protein [Sediminibacterium sp.]
MKVQLFLGLLFASIISADAQVSPLQFKQHLVTLDSFYQLSPIEKAYIQTDKDWYTPGENIWFKGYTTVENQLTELSKVFYVDLLNSNDSVLVKTMWKVEKNSFKGDMTIPAALVAGRYKLRIYSLWMLNTPELIDEKTISILSPTPAVDLSKPNFSKFKVYLFPEGGYLVNGLKNLLAFKITNKEGLPVSNALVSLEDDTGTIVSSIKPFHQGMGSFDFIPNKNSNYKVGVTIEGVKYIPEFPAIEATGITLQVNPINNNRIFYSINRLETNNNIIPEVYVVAHINGVSFYTEKIQLNDLSTGGAILKKDLPHGVLSISVFNTNMLPLAERLVFIKKVQQIQPEIVIKNINLQSKGKNAVKVIFPLDSANVSVSVTAAEQLNNSHSNNTIASYFLLNSEIKGYIHEPEYYFANNDSSHNAALDLLMQTQGWRRITWKSVLSKQLPPLNYYIETGISVRGFAIPSGNKKVAPNDAKMNLILKGEDSTTIIAEALLLDGGKFVVNNLDFRKKANIYFQGTKMNSKNADVALKLLPNYFDSLSNWRNSKLNFAITDTIAAALKTKLIKNYYNTSLTGITGLTLGNVTVTSKVKSKEQRLTEEYATGWYQNSDFTFAIDSLIGFSSIWQYLQGMVPGLNVNGDIFNPTVNFSRFSVGVSDATLLSESIYESLNTVNGEVKSRIAFFINEMPVSIDYINSMSPRDIALIKVNRNANVMTNATAGSMFIYTRKGFNPNGKSMDKTSIFGYSVAKEYFSPIYETEESKLTIDKRSSLYWNPQLKINNKQANFNFYNSDVAKKIKIIIEGFDKDGIPIRAEKLIE